MEDAVDKVLENPDFTPVLFIGRYVIEFKRKYPKKIHNASSLEDVRYIIENYTGMQLEDYMVLDGIGFLSGAGSNSLLKFVEEASFPVVLLSYYDRVIPTIMSRMKFVFKSSPVKVEELSFIPLQKCLELVEDSEGEKDFTYYDRLKLYTENNPMAYFFDKSGSWGNADKKINRIISKIK